MTAGLETQAAEEFIYSTLSGDATLMAQLPGGVWNVQANERAPYPLVVFQFMSGIDAAAVGALRIWTSMIYLVKAIAEADNFAALNSAVARIDALLHRTSGTAADGTVWTCTREQAIRLPDSVAGRQYRQAGGLFRINAS